MGRDIIDRLLKSDEPSIRYKVRVNVLCEDGDSRAIRTLRNDIRKSARAAGLLAGRASDGTIAYHPYKKWCGAHWVLAALADIGYPPGDKTLSPMADQVYGWLLSSHHETKSTREIDGRVRRCASQEGNAVWSTLTLGLADGRADELASRLIKWQWSDGGWNCDKRAEAAKSSFHETLLPLRALALYGRMKGSKEALAAAKRAAEIFLRRKMFKRLKDGQVMDPEFLLLCYPSYWHYDILSGLRVMAEAGFIRDRRCTEALDYLESRRLGDGGFPADTKCYTMPTTRSSGASPVAWGRVSKKKTNEFVTVDALYALARAGRFAR